MSEMYRERKKLKIVVRDENHGNKRIKYINIINVNLSEICIDHTITFQTTYIFNEIQRTSTQLVLNYYFSDLPWTKHDKLLRYQNATSIFVE